MCGFYMGRKVILKVNERKVLAEVICFFFHSELFLPWVTSSPEILSPVTQPE